MLYNIAIVEENPRLKKSLSQRIKAEYADALPMNILSFKKGEEFLSSEQAFDIVLFDLNAPASGGMDAVERYRKSNAHASLILFGESLADAVRGYAVDACGFVSKEAPAELFNVFMNTAIKTQKSRKPNKLLIKTELGNTLLPLQKIIYIQVQGHHLYFYCLNGNEVQTVKARGSLKDFEARLADTEFVRCSVYCLINMHYIFSIKGSTVQLKEGEISIPVGRSFYKNFKKRFLEFTAKNKEGQT